MRLRLPSTLGLTPLILGLAAATGAAQPAVRPMTFLDMQHIRSTGSITPSPDGNRVLYTLSVPDWVNARSQTDLYLVSVREGVPSTRRLTFTEDKNESAPAWSSDGAYFAFLSDRESTGANGGRQLYVMRTDGGEARRITNVPGGVSDFAFTRDGRAIVLRAGRNADQQLHRLTLPIGDSLPSPEALTRHTGGVSSWTLSPDGTRVFFTGPDADTPDERTRREQRFTVDIRNAVTPIASLWRVDLTDKQVTRLTRDSTYSVQTVVVSPDGRWVGFTGGSAARYERNITEAGINGDLFLLEVASGQIERLTQNREVSEGDLSFSPDSRRIAFSAPDDLTRYTMSNQRVYLRDVSARGTPFRKLGASFDGNVGIDFWSADGNTIYFNEGIKATRQLLALDVAKDVVRQLTTLPAALTVTRDDKSGLLLVSSPT
jgi:Tol biopolymer transport system component